MEAARPTKRAAVRLMAAFVLSGCSTAGGPASQPDAGPTDATTYVNPSCPVSFSGGCPGFDASYLEGGGCAPFHCQAIPLECEQDATCGCISCASTTCDNLCSYAGGPSNAADCRYADGTFTVECINP
jgi:hypothetical protein